MNLLPKSSTEFSSTDYWDSFFKKRGKKAFEWYGEYLELCEILHKYIKTTDKILIIGCGNSTLGIDLHNVGYSQIVNIDVSHVVIKEMKTKVKPGLEFLQMDALNTTFEDCSFSVVLDKGTLDALMPDSTQSTLDQIDKLFHETDRVLKQGGRYICISLLQVHILKYLLEQFTELGWMIRVCRCPEAENKSISEGGRGLPVFAVICTKLKKMAQMKLVYEVCLYGDTIQRMESIDEMLAAIKAAQDAAMICTGLNRCSLTDSGEVVIDLTKPNEKEPRYTVIVADKDDVKDASNMTFAAFIVPQRREHEWLFGVPEGRKTLVKSSGFDRLAIVHLHRDHIYTSLKDVQEETADVIMRLSPPIKNNSKAPIIPYLSVGSDIGNCKEIARGESKMSGGYVIEEIEDSDKNILRRLIFLSNQNCIQSEAKLKTVKIRGKVSTVIDYSYLACDHHTYMTLGVNMVAKPKDMFDMLVIGLGGGALSMYLHACFKQATINTVDIDPVVHKIAKEHFGLKENKNLKVTIDDGIQFIHSVSTRGNVQ
uniref:Methyltransferase type 11 domain-containing protein n=1 Tax=Clastoptera arizonana TaxID=38151 RepID=A0A1B6D8N5_9HEMI